MIPEAPKMMRLDDAPTGKGLMHTSPPPPMPSPAHLGNQIDVMA